MQLQNCERIQFFPATLCRGGSYPDFTIQSYFHNICLDAACYTLKVYDSYGDGIDNGYYTLTDPTNTVLVTGNGQFTSERTHNFCASSLCAGFNFGVLIIFSLISIL